MNSIHSGIGYKLTGLVILLGLSVLLIGCSGGVSVEADDADDVRFFSFVAVTGADAVDGVFPRLGMNGAGVFDPDTGEASGGGTFEIFDGAPEGPKPSLRSAEWEVKRVIEWTPCAPPDTCTTPGDTTFGNITAGVVDLEVDVKLDSGQEIEGLTLKLICNIGFAGIINKDADGPLPEGYFLIIPDLGDLGTLEFKPLSPILGITHIGVDPGVDIELDDDDDDD